MKRQTKKRRKSFYIISALRDDSSPLGKLSRMDTEREAVEHAKGVVDRRARCARPPMEFYVLKVMAVVEPVATPIRITKLS